MIIRQEQLKVRYKQLFPLNISKEELQNLLQLTINTPNKVLIESEGVNPKGIFFSLLLKYIQKYDRLPTMENITGLNLSELFFLQGSGNLDYTDINSFKSDILTLNYSIVDPPSKKTVELICYLMYQHVEVNHKAVWVFTRPGVPSIIDVAKKLNYTIIKLNSSSSKKTTSVTNKSYINKSKNMDLF